MPDARDLGIQLAFENVSYLIDNEITQPSDTSIAYLHVATKFIDTIVDSLNTLNATAGRERSTTYHFVPNLKEVAAMGAEQAPSIKITEIDKLVDFFTYIKKEIEKIKYDSVTFYRSKSKELIKKFCDKTASIYSGDAIQVESELVGENRSLVLA